MKKFIESMLIVTVIIILLTVIGMFWMFLEADAAYEESLKADRSLYKECVYLGWQDSCYRFTAQSRYRIGHVE